MTSPLRAASALALCLLLAACIVVPSTRESYDPQCKVMKREMTLEVAQAARLRSCGGNECAAMMAAAGIVTAASAVVSGSIALVGNGLFWLERQGKCVAEAPAAAPPGPQRAASAP
jgi:hypothetical protein